MTQPPTYPTPPVGGPAPTAGGFAPPSGPATQGYAVPPQFTPAGHPPPGWVPPPGHLGPPRPAPTLTPAGQPLASFTDRLLAALVDAAVFYGVGLVLAVPALIIFFAVVLPDLVRIDPDGTVVQPDLWRDLVVPFLWMELAVLAISFVVAYVYHVEMMFRTGQTYGKKVMKLRVVPLDPDRSLDRGAAVRRFLVQQVGGLVPGLGYLDGLWQLWDKPWQQCLHDRFAGTVVVKVAP